MSELSTNDVFFVESFERKLNLRKHLQSVLSWNLIAKGSHIATKESIALQYKLVKEERAELFCDGIKDRSPVEFLDALCDLFVVSTYWAFLRRLEYSSLLKNIKNGDSEDNDLYSNAEEYVADLLDSFGGSGLNLPDLIKELNDLVEERDPYGTVNILSEILLRLDVDVDAALREVTASNASKMPNIEFLRHTMHLTYDPNGSTAMLDMSDDELVNKQAEILNTELADRYSGITGTIVDGKTCVFREEGGKIVKPCTFYGPTEMLKCLLPEI